MTSIGAYEAKTKLPWLLERVRGGESIVITKHGHPVARLVPAEPVDDDPADIAAQLRAARAGITLGDDTIRSLIDEGRL